MAENTKERILDAAFSFYSKPVFREISLSQIAEKVGITKAAIFKHFKNKDALKQAMQDKMYGDIAEVLCEMQQKYLDLKDQEALPLVIQFIAEHIEYLNYMIVSLEELTEDNLFLLLKKYGVTLLDTIYNEDGKIKSLSGYFKSIYASSTMLIFILIRQNIISGKLCTEGIKITDTQDFSKKLSLLIEHGINGKDANIRMIRLTEIDGICNKSMENLKEIDRILLALARVISAEGITGITVDKVAKELGMAKSSLYTWFSNKNEMIKTLVKDEMKQMYSIMAKNMKEMNTSGERLYVMLQTVLSYLMLRPELLDICRWIQMSDDMQFENDKDMSEFFAFQESFFNLIDLGFTGNSEKLSMISAGWFFSLPVLLLLHGRSHNFELPILQAAMKDMYFMVQFGIASGDFEK